MAALASGDAERLLHFVADAESFGGDEPFSGEVLVELGRLVPADWISYSEFDYVRDRKLHSVDRDGDDWPGWACDDAFRQAMTKEHPIVLRHRQGDFGALKLSDFLTRRELHRTPLYDLVLRRWGIEYVLDVAIPSPPWNMKTFSLDRRRKDFSERDRLVLNLLQRHLARLWNAARTRRRLAAALAGLDQASERDVQGVVLLGSGDRVDYASPPARRLLREFFSDSDKRSLPAPLVDWVRSGSPHPLHCHRGPRGLTVKRVDNALLLRERQEGMRLTRREREVLAWVARGKTNAEIARVLWVAPGTVRKHLENIYAKLGVRTRTAAAADYFGLIDSDQDSAGAVQACE